MLMLRNRSGNTFLLLFSMIVGLLLFCTGCGSSTSTGTQSSPVTYDHTAGHILVRLFNAPGFIYPPVNGVPEWTLYGDGTLLFKTFGARVSLDKAQLSPSEVQHILDVVVNQNAFFASSKATYGQMAADVGSTTVSVTANGQQKEVRLLAKPTGTQDSETNHVFAIQDFLLSYHPTNAQNYAPTGVALLVMAQPKGAKTPTAWPYNDISLAQVVDHECTLLRFGANASCTSTNAQAGLVPLYGQRGLTLFTQTQTSTYTVFSQQGKFYQIIVWPLLPDALLPQTNGAHSVAVQGSQSETWTLLQGFGQPS